MEEMSLTELLRIVRKHAFAEQVRAHDDRNSRLERALCDFDAATLEVQALLVAREKASLDAELGHLRKKEGLR